MLSGCPGLEGVFFSLGLVRSHFQLVVHCQQGYVCLGGHWFMLRGFVNTGFSPAAPSDNSVLAGATGAQDE